MKIVFVIDHFGNGGAERVVSVLSDSMVKSNHEVIVVVSKDDKNYEVNQKIKYLVAETSISNKILRRIHKTNIIKKYIEQEHPDIVFSFGYYMNLYVLAACKNNRSYKLVISERTDPIAEPNNKVLRMIRNICYKKADILVCQTDQASEYFTMIPKKKKVVIPNPIKSDLPTRNLCDRKKTIVTACRLEKQKNLTLLIDAFKEIEKNHPEYRLIIYGDGSLKDSLKQYVLDSELVDKVEFPGFSKDIHNEIIDAGMYVSSSDYEGISNSMLEAMGIGLPIICTDCPVGGAAMAIENGVNGLLVPIGNKKELVSAIETYICNPELAEKYGIKSLEVNERFNVNRISEMWLGLL